jgi:hypothetical protein
MLTKVRTLIAGAAATAALGLTAGIAAPALATTPAPSTTTTTLPTVYQGKIVNQSIVLGPQSNPTLLTQTPPLPAGTYLVTAHVGATIASQDQIVCAVSNVPHGNDGVFGTAGNPGSAAFVYGSAAMTDTLHATAGQRISVTCNSFNYGLGTGVSNAVVEAIPVAKVN